MSTKTTTSALETAGIEHVGDGDRHGKPSSQFTLWFTSNIQFATLVTGALATAVLGLPFWAAAVAIAVGTCLGSALLALMSSLGPRLGSSQLVQSRGPFGYYGNYVIAALTFLNGCGWFAVSTVLGVFALQALAPALPFTAGLVILAIAQVLVAVFGYRVIHQAGRILAIVLGVLFLILAIYAAFKLDLGPMPHPAASGPLGFSGAFILVVAITSARTLGFSPYASDFSRHLPATTAPRRVFRNGFFGAALGGVWVSVVGAALGTLGNIGSPADLVAHALPAVLAIATLIVLILSTAVSSCVDIYSASLATLVMGLPLRRWAAALIVGAIGTGVAWLAGTGNYYNNFQSFLQFVGYWIGPWIAVMLIRYVTVSRGRFRIRDLYSRDHALGAGLISFIVGVLASIPFMNQSGMFVGPFAAANPHWGDITNLVGFLVSGIVFLALTRLSKRTATAPGAFGDCAESAADAQGTSLRVTAG